jgi:hypothetical protein
VGDTDDCRRADRGSRADRADRGSRVDLADDHSDA